MALTLVLGAGYAYATTDGEEDLQAGTVEAISLTPEGEYGNGGSGNSDISAEGRYVVYGSAASDLTADDTNGVNDIFITDRLYGDTSLISANEEGVQGNAASSQPSISANGQFVAFQSDATNLVPGQDANEYSDIFVRDLDRGVVTLMSVSSGGAQGNGDSTRPSVTSDGERVYVAYQSVANNLTGVDNMWADNNGVRDVFVSYYWLDDPDREVFTELVSRRTDGSQGNRASGDPSISGDGSYVVYESKSRLDRDLDEYTSDSDIYLTEWEADTESGYETTMISSWLDGPDSCLNPAISNNGFTIVFDITSEESGTQVWVLPDWRVPYYESPNATPVSGNADWLYWGNGNSEYASVSGDGRYVVFESDASDLVYGDYNNKRDIFVRDLREHVTYLISQDVFGNLGNGRSGNEDNSSGPAITPSYGDVVPQVAFFSRATNLTSLVDGIEDTNGAKDVFVGTIDLRPTIYSIEPPIGTTEGGTIVYIFGTNFLDFVGVADIAEVQETLSGLGVTFDGVDATNVVHYSTMKLIVTSPAHTAGTVQVQVTTPIDSTEDTEADDYTYVAPVVPVVPVTPIAPKRGHSRHQQDDSMVTYTGKWTDDEDDGLSKRSGKSTSDKTATITITFKGTQLDWIASLGPNMGKALVSVDGGEAVLVDLNSATELFQQLVWSTGVLAYGKHTVTITFPEGTDYVEGKSINIDAVDVYGDFKELEVTG
jgi:hypothetical protein